MSQSTVIRPAMAAGNASCPKIRTEPESSNPKRRSRNSQRPADAALALR